MSGATVERGAAGGFPFGVSPEAAGQDREGRGPDTMNRLLMHAARYHDRPVLSARWEERRKGWGWQPMPDWRADRHTTRVALVLRQRLEVADGETVALWLPLSTEWPLIERGVWSIGAVSVPVGPEWDLDRVAEVLADAAPGVLFGPSWEAVRDLQVIGGVPDAVRAIIVMQGEPDDPEQALPYARFMDYGGVLDTPERAAMWRTLARGIAPDVAISREYTPEGELRWGKLDHRWMVRGVERIIRRFPPAAGRVQVLTGERPDPTLRALVYAAWVDGLTQTVFAASDDARAGLSAYSPALVAGPGALLSSALDAVRATARPPRGPVTRPGLVARLLGAGKVPQAPGAGAGHPAPVDAIVTDGVRPTLDGSHVDVQFVEQSEIEISPTGPGFAGQGSLF